MIAMTPPFLLTFLLLLLGGAMASITIALKCDNGVVIGSDSYYISSAKSSYISSTEAYKVDFITDSTIMCRIGTERTNGAEYFQFLDEITSSVKLIDCESQHISSLDGQGSRHSSVLGTGAIAALARKLMTSKYRNTHVIIAGIDDVNYRRSRREHQTMTKKSLIIGSEYKPRFAMFEILPGGAKIGDATFLTAGTSAALVNPLLEQLLASAADSRKEQQVSTRGSAGSGIGDDKNYGMSLFGKFLNLFNIFDDSILSATTVTENSSYDTNNTSGNGDNGDNVIDEAAAVRAMQIALRAASRGDSQSGGKLSAFLLFWDGHALDCQAC